MPGVPPNNSRGRVKSRGGGDFVPFRLRGSSVKWVKFILWTRAKVREWERDSRFWAFHTGSR